MEGRVFEFFPKNQKCFKNPKMPKIVPKMSKRFQNPKKVVQTCFEHVLGVIFSKKNFAQCSMEGRVFEFFQKNQKSFKIPKKPKIVPKSVQTCFEQV